MEWIKKNSSKTIFIVVVIVALAICVWHYKQTTTHFQSSCERICAEHKNLCKQLPILAAAVHKDSVFVVNADALVIIQSNHAQIENMLELQHGEIQEDFSSLMLWASVLMVIFLIFSIYSMYRVDELVNQSRSSVSTIITLSEKAQEKISNVDKLFQKESEKLATQSENEIQKLKDTQTQQIQELDSEVRAKFSEYTKQITQASDQFNNNVNSKAIEVIKQMEAIQQSTQPLTQLLEFIRSSSANGDDGKNDQQ